ncbi:hypothetical protein [Streptosporangium sp. V21-05]|uniref:hypothetical protein n=1 Tax=Streptosporangium sp. V21-05 TaxID=3446115 RepID=UPI003F539732
MWSPATAAPTTGTAHGTVPDRARGAPSAANTAAKVVIHRRVCRDECLDECRASADVARSRTAERATSARSRIVMDEVSRSSRISGP